MTALRHAIICILVFTQAVVASGFGPRALCRTSDGRIQVDSLLSPCCCHDDEAEPCCGDDGTSDTSRPMHIEPGLASTCDCVCTPVASQPVIARHGDSKPSLDRADATLPVAAPVLHWVMADLAAPSGSVARSRPPDGALPGHIRTVILRL